MAARRDDNPPEDWQEKITDQNEAKKTGRSGEMKGTYTVNDRRHWAESSGDEADSGEEIPIKPPSYVQVLEEELRIKDETLKEYIAQYKAAKSEMNEAIGRIERDKAREINFRIAELARTFLTIIDDLEAAMRAVDKSDNASSIARGLDLINQRIKSTLENIGIVEIDAEGKPHDPNLHEAVAVDAVDDPEKEGVIIEVLSKGYLLGDVLVRPAQVVVGKYGK